MVVHTSRMQLAYILDMIIGNYPTGDAELEN